MLYHLILFQVSQTSSSGLRMNCSQNESLAGRIAKVIITTETNATGETADERIPLQEFIWRYYDQWEKATDYKVSGWPLVQEWWATLVLVLLYGYVTCWLGPRFMTKRKPYNLKTAMTVYNAFQVIFSTTIFITCIRGGMLNGYNLICQPVENVSVPRSIIMAQACWLYFISKFIDFTDTAFFVLRKKYNQITLLHVIHHAGMPMFSYGLVKLLPGGHAASIPLLNSFVHAVMYSYYLLAGMGPQMQKYLWWKKYLTILQMAQFAILNVHHSLLFFIDCEFPTYSAFISIIMGPLLIVSFLDFYLHSYKKSSTAAKGTKNGSIANSSNGRVQCNQ